jgi:hypothetical protein
VHCPFCFGWELRDQPLAVLASGPHAAAQALMWRQWSQDVALFLHTVPRPGPEQLEQLAARGISIVEGDVTGVEVIGGRLSGLRLRSARQPPGCGWRGNTADVAAGVMQAAASGVTAAAAINADLTAEDTTAAVAAQRRAVKRVTSQVWHD